MRVLLIVLVMMAWPLMARAQTSENASKIAGFTVLNGLSENASKVVGFVVLNGAIEGASKVLGFAVLQGGPSGVVYPGALHLGTERAYGF